MFLLDRNVLSALLATQLASPLAAWIIEPVLIAILVVEIINLGHHW